jgi:hypothetical protein
MYGDSAEAERSAVADVVGALEAAVAALDSMEPSDLGAVLGEADALRLREPPIEKVRETLGLPAERFLSEQLKAAKRHGDIPREDALNTAIKDLIFERSGDAFDLAKLPRLRTADEFANAKMGGKKERREGFLRHQSKPIPTSLTQLDSKEKREEAVSTFKSILGYMGDAPYQFPIMLAVELVTKALSGGGELQTEVYTQLMKQLSDNPSEASKRLGWQLLALVLQCFPPDAMVENYIEAFLREKATPDPRAYTSLMYAAVRRGPLSAAPTEEEILSMLTKDLGSSQRVSRASRAQ